VKRYAFLILFAIVLVMPAVFSRIVARPGPPPPPSNALKLDIVTPHNQDIRNAFADSFSAWHLKKYGTPVDVRFNNPGGTGDIRRLLESSYRDVVGTDGRLTSDTYRPPFDVVWGGGDFFFDVEIKRFLQPVDLPQALLDEVFPEPTLSGVRLYDFQPQTSATRPAARPKWIGICISAFGLVYNPDVYKSLKLPEPRTWQDLTRPELFSWIALANPVSSSSAAVSYSMVYQRAMADEEEAFLKTRPDLVPLRTADRMKDPAYMEAITRGWKRGMSDLLLISANGRYFTDSGSQPPNDVANGDAAAAMAIDFYARANEWTMGTNRFRLLLPDKASAFNPDPVGILLGVKGEKYTLANRFIEYLLTREAQLVWIIQPGTEGAAERPLFRTPIRRDVYDLPDKSAWTHPHLNPFTDTSGFLLRNEWNTMFTETRWLWAISWIDARDELRDAYRKVLAVKDSERREKLLAQLADFPISYQQLAAIRADIRGQPRDTIDEYRAKERIRLAQFFREHYNRIAAEAQP
jgi:ABC-type Fe3+ transport system substrate-binding protein